MASKKVLDKSDITKLGLWSSFLQASFNFERMQSGGFTMSQIPAFRKIFKDDKQGMATAMTDNLEFINTHPNLVGFLLGLLISLEEAHENRGTIRGLKIALFGPLAGIGDAIFWFTLLPIVAGICSSMAMDGNIVGPIIFFAVYLTIFLLRIVWTHLGYNLGVKAIETIKAYSGIISKCATILGITVIGGLIASYINIELLVEIPVNEVKSVMLQADFFDNIFPKIIPLAYTLTMFAFLRKKASPMVLIAVTFVLAILLSFLGIL